MKRFPSVVFRALYKYLNFLDRDHQVIFMNYGYSDSGNPVQLDKQDEKNRYPVQLYHHMAEMTDLQGKDMVEVGSGRGGGLEYICRKFKPASAKGIDIESSAVSFSKKFHWHKNLSFITGNARKLPLPDNSCDILLNVESSHRYSSMISFLKEVHRVLRPDGYFLFTDFRENEKWKDLRILLNQARFEVVEEKDISSKILQSLEMDSARRLSLVKKYAPRILQKDILNFTGARGTDTFDHFSTGKITYKSFKLKKF